MEGTLHSLQDHSNVYCTVIDYPTVISVRVSKGYGAIRLYWWYWWLWWWWFEWQVERFVAPARVKLITAIMAAAWGQSIKGQDILDSPEVIRSPPITRGLHTRSPPTPRHTGASAEFIEYVKEKARNALRVVCIFMIIAVLNEEFILDW